jgi:hypothetical protein
VPDELKGKKLKARLEFGRIPYEMNVESPTFKVEKQAGLFRR